MSIRPKAKIADRWIRYMEDNPDKYYRDDVFSNLDGTKLGVIGVLVHLYQEETGSPLSGWSALTDLDFEDWLGMWPFKASTDTYRLEKLTVQNFLPIFRQLVQQSDTTGNYKGAIDYLRYKILRRIK